MLVRRREPKPGTGLTEYITM